MGGTDSAEDGVAGEKASADGTVRDAATAVDRRRTFLIVSMVDVKVANNQCVSRVKSRYGTGSIWSIMVT